MYFFIIFFASSHVQIYVQSLVFNCRYLFKKELTLEQMSNKLDQTAVD
jgi:hypothetical protein